MNQIEKQKRVIQSIEAEVETARARAIGLSQELAALQNATEPGDLSRRAGLVLAVEKARDELPILPPPLGGEWRPALQQELEREQDKLDVLYHQAWSLSRSIQRIEGVDGAWAGRLPEVRIAWALIAETFNKANFHPEGMSGQMLHGISMVLSNMQREIGGLPALCQRLAGLGFDSEWRPQGWSWQDEVIDNEFGGK